jgi:transcriptional regulator with XRE-family HTH domain
VAVAGGGRTRVGEVDRHVARRVRERRLALGLTQARLARLVGVTPQQLHKYETGTRRIMAGWLARLAEALGVGPVELYEGLEATDEGLPAGRKRATLELARSFLAIADPRQQKALLALARALAGDGDEAGADGA